MVATDSYRLSVRETQADVGETEDFEVNVPARALQEASRIIADAKPDRIAIFAAENQVVFGIGPVVLSSRMIDGQFPELPAAACRRATSRRSASIAAS